jgi:hypothetical protein
MTDEDSEEQYGPESPVWSHLWSGIDLAEMEFDAVDSD